MATQTASMRKRSSQTRDFEQKLEKLRERYADTGATIPMREHVSPAGGFTEPEYASVGFTESRAREAQEIVTAVTCFDSTMRTIIDGRQCGVFKLIADRRTGRILGCRVVGERAVDIIEVAAIAIAAGLRVDERASVPLSFPTYAGIVAQVAVSAARQLNLEVSWHAHRAEGA